MLHGDCVSITCIALRSDFILWYQKRNYCWSSGWLAAIFGVNFDKIVFDIWIPCIWLRDVLTCHIVGKRICCFSNPVFSHPTIQIFWYSNLDEHQWLDEEKQVRAFTDFIPYSWAVIILLLMVLTKYYKYLLDSVSLKKLWDLIETDC